jgi:hypothetical protein
MWCWRRIEKISCTDRVKKWKTTKSQREKKHLTYKKTMRSNWTGHIFHRNYLLKHIIERKKEGMRRWTRCKKLLNNLKEERGYRKWTQEALDCSLCRIWLESGYRPVTRQTTEWANKFSSDHDSWSINKYDIHRSTNNLPHSENCQTWSTEIIKSTPGVNIRMNKKQHFKVALNKYLNTHAFTWSHDVKNDSSPFYCTLLRNSITSLRYISI